MFTKKERSNIIEEEEALKSNIWLKIFFQFKFRTFEVKLPQCSKFYILCILEYTIAWHLTTIHSICAQFAQFPILNNIFKEEEIAKPGFSLLLRIAIWRLTAV